MTRLTASLGFLLVLAALAPAQDRSGADDERDDRLAMYLRTGRYADARRPIDEMLKTEPHDDLKNVRVVFGSSGPNMRVRQTAASRISGTRVCTSSPWLPWMKKTLEFLLDTGNQAGTQFWERFGKISNYS